MTDPGVELVIEAQVLIELQVLIDLKAVMLFVFESCV